VDCCARLDAC